MKLARCRSALLGVLMLLVAPLVTTTITATPAHATHEWVWGHWWNDFGGEYPAPPIWDRNNTFRWGTQAGNQYAFGWGADQWTRITTYIGVPIMRPWLQTVGGDPWDCSPHAWTIVVCLGHPGTDSAGRVNLMSMQPWYFDNQNHFIAAVIRINPWHDWRDSEQLMNVAEHELGHAIGLGHRFGVLGSIMDQNTARSDTLRYPDDHDRDALVSMYYYHGH